MVNLNINTIIKRLYKEKKQKNSYFCKLQRKIKYYYINEQD